MDIPKIIMFLKHCNSLESPLFLFQRKKARGEEIDIFEK